MMLTTFNYFHLFKICQSLSNTTSEWKSNWDVESSEAIAKVKMATETRVVSYDSPRSIANKVRYAVQKGLGGVMVWSVDTDDFQGDCDEKLNEDRFSDFRTQPKVKLNLPKLTTRTYPLLRTLNDAIVLTLDEMSQEQSDNDNNINDKDNEIDSNESTQQKPNKPSGATAAALSSLFVVLLTNILLKTL